MDKTELANHADGVADLLAFKGHARGVNYIERLAEDGTIEYTAFCVTGASQHLLRGQDKVIHCSRPLSYAGLANWRQFCIEFSKWMGCHPQGLDGAMEAVWVQHWSDHTDTDEVVERLRYFAKDLREVVAN